MRHARRSRPSRFRTTLLYIRALMYEFRWTLLLLVILLTWGTLVYRVSPGELVDAGEPVPAAGIGHALYAAWMAMLGQPVKNLPETWHIRLLCMAYPIIGFVVIGEGVVRLAILMFSRRHGREEWMKVMASTYRHHAVVCGVGRLGIRVIEQFIAAKIPVIAIEKDASGSFVAQARQWDIPLIIGNMRDDATLVDAGIPHASIVVIATNDDMANIEVALDSRRMNPQIRVVMRLFEQSIAQKMANAFLVDVAFSATTLAAPMVAAMALGAKVVGTSVIAGIPHVTAEVRIQPGSDMAGVDVARIETDHVCKVLALVRADGSTHLPPAACQLVNAGDLLTLHTPSAQLTSTSAAASV